MKGPKNEWDSKRRTQISYYAAKRRCEDPSATSYPRFGGKGIRFRIKSWQHLIKLIGLRPCGKALGRFNTSRDYVRGNIYWATPKQLQQNTKTRKLTPELITKIKECKKRGLKLAEIGWILGVPSTTVRRGYKSDK